MLEEKLISICKASELLGITIVSLRSYPEDILKSIKTKGGHRRYRLSDVQRLQGLDIKNNNNDETTAVYCRVSSHDQKEKGDLERQKARLLEYTSLKNYKVKHIYEEVGSGMNDNRSKLKQILKLVNAHAIKRVVIEHKDRLTRFNFSIYKEYFNSHDVEIEYINETLTKTFEDELVEDMLSLMSSFSAKIYGKRSHQNRKKNENTKK